VTRYGLRSLINCGEQGAAIFRRVGIVSATISAVLLAGAGLFAALLHTTRADGQVALDVPAATISATPSAPARPVARPQPPTVAEALDSGVLIVVSKGSQQLQVFRQGQPWLTAPVSTGKRGHGTPAGVFPILEKARFHRSNIYSNAPMPFMQRLTMGGIAIHAGHLPGYPASHGCIRVSAEVARALFGLTGVRSTIVVVVNEAIHSENQARQLALAVQRPQRTALAAIAPAPTPAPAPEALAARSPLPAVNFAAAQGAGETIQLAAAGSAEEAGAHWRRLVGKRAELAALQVAFVPAVVGSRRYVRLRASGPGAFATCSQLRGAGIDCFKVL